jgi:hypothetical protein
MIRLLRHRQTKGAETDRQNLTLPRHISTLPKPDNWFPAAVVYITTFFATGDKKIGGGSFFGFPGSILLEGDNVERFYPNRYFY